jgi:hypothetical protein
MEPERKVRLSKITDLEDYEGRPKRPPTPEEVALFYYTEHGDYYPPRSEPARRNWQLGVAIGVAVAAIAALVTVLFVSGSAHHKPTQATPAKKSIQVQNPATLIRIVPGPGPDAFTFDVRLSSFKIKITASNGPTGITAVNVGRPDPFFHHVLPASGEKTFVVQRAMTILMGSPPGRAYVYDGTKAIGYFFPTTGPVLMFMDPLRP